jgi:putative hemolysin
MEVLILFGLIVLNGLFAMSEIALVTSRKAKLQKLIDQGHPQAKVAIALGENPTKFLSTIQIGITSIGILNGVVGESAIAVPMSHYFIEHGCPICRMDCTWNRSSFNHILFNCYRRTCA